jgi:hypothetical protein
MARVIIDSNTIAIDADALAARDLHDARRVHDHFDLTVGDLAQRRQHGALAVAQARG